MVAPARCVVIAEAGVNHNGSLDLALKLIDAAAEAAADAVKFQTFRAERLVARGTPTAEYQAKNTGATDQHAMLTSLELPDSAYPALIERCAARRIEFMSTPFDGESARMLFAHGVQRIKIGSGDVTSLAFLEEIAALGLPVILSTGMSTLEEVAEAVETFSHAWAGALKDRLVLLHCTSTYPAREQDVNLRAMRTLQERFGLPTGYSDHTEGTSVALAAVARTIWAPLPASNGTGMRAQMRRPLASMSRTVSPKSGERCIPVTHTDTSSSPDARASSRVRRISPKSARVPLT